MQKSVALIVAFPVSKLHSWKGVHVNLHPVNLDYSSVQIEISFAPASSFTPGVNLDCSDPTGLDRPSVRSSCLLPASPIASLGLALRCKLPF